MSLTMIDAVLRHSSSRGTARHVLMVLAHHANGEGKAWPSQGTLARECGLSVRAVRNALHDLDEAGEIEASGLIHRCTIWLVSPGRNRHEVPTTDNGNPAPDAGYEVTNPEPCADYTAPQQSVRDCGVTGISCRRNRHEVPTNPQEPSYSEVTGLDSESPPTPSQESFCSDHSTSPNSLRASWTDDERERYRDWSDADAEQHRAFVRSMREEVGETEHVEVPPAPPPEDVSAIQSTRRSPDDDTRKLRDALRHTRPNNSGKVVQIDFRNQHLGDQVGKLRQQIEGGAA